MFLTFGTRWREERCLQKFGSKAEGGNLFEDLSVLGNVIFKWILQYMVELRGLV
jgi:hypothetical protein